jgi:hypothetical protein
MHMRSGRLYLPLGRYVSVEVGDGATARFD